MADRRNGVRPPTDGEIRGADWYGEDLSGRECTRVTLSGVDLGESTDDGAVFTECTFHDCRLNLSRPRDWAAGAMLTHLDLSAACLSGADLSGADLRGSDLSAVDPREVELAGAQVDVTQAVVLVTALGLRVRPDVPG